MIENKLFNLVLTIILCLNASIILFPSNFKFIPILFLLAFAIYNFMKTKEKDTLFFVFASIPYLLLIVGMFYTEDISYGFKKLETGSALILYPLCFALLPKEVLEWQINNRIYYILGAFCFATFVFSIYFFLFFIILEDRSLSYILQHNNILMDVSIHTKYRIHPIYLALNVGISIIFSIFILKNHKNNIIRLLTLLFSLYAVLLLAVINKRMAIIAILIVGLIYVVLQLKKINNKKRTLFYYVVVFIVILLGIIYFPRYKNQNSFNEFKNITLTINNPETSIGKRVYLYKSAFNLFLKNPLLGVGTGDANRKLSIELATLLHTESEDYNSHNQYLSYLISVGLLGFIIFIYYIFYILKISFVNNDILLLFLFIFLCLNMISENILEREAGVLVYAFFINFLLRSYKKIKS
jgi:O-antigen ligase